MSEEIYRNFYNYYHPKILFHKEKEKKWVTSFVVSFTGGLGLFLLVLVVFLHYLQYYYLFLLFLFHTAIGKENKTLELVWKNY